MTTHDDLATASGAPNAALLSNLASALLVFIESLERLTKKKPARIIPAGSLTMPELYY
jgi:hypothetical protein